MDKTQISELIGNFRNSNSKNTDLETLNILLKNLDSKFLKKSEFTNKTNQLKVLDHESSEYRSVKKGMIVMLEELIQPKKSGIVKKAALTLAAVIGLSVATDALPNKYDTGVGVKNAYAQEITNIRRDYPWDKVEDNPENILGRVDGIKKDEWIRGYFNNEEIRSLFKKPEQLKQIMMVLTDGDINNEELQFVSMKNGYILFKIKNTNPTLQKGYFASIYIGEGGVQLIKRYIPTY